MDWDAIRAEFPALSNWTYLNTATFGQLPRAATEAMSRHWAHRDETACADFLDWFSDANRLRGTIAKLIRATADDIAFIPSAAHAISFVAGGIDLSDPSSNVVTLEDDFPNQLYLPRLREVPWPRFFDSIDAGTKLIAISEVNYATGFRPPLKSVCDFVAGLPEDRKPILFVDGTQSAGALRVNLNATPVDVYAAHGYKWLLSPNGAGFAYFSPKARLRLKPNVVGWRSHRDWRSVDTLHHGTPVFKESAEKYEGGGLPSGLLYAMEASVNLILSIGPELIEERVIGMAADVRSRLKRLGGVVQETAANHGEPSQIIAMRFPGRDASELSKALRFKGVLVAARHGHLRISPHFYNNQSDLDRLEQELKGIL